MRSPCHVTQYTNPQYTRSSPANRRTKPAGPPPSGSRNLSLYSGPRPHRPSVGQSLHTSVLQLWTAGTPAAPVPSNHGKWRGTCVSGTITVTGAPMQGRGTTTTQVGGRSVNHSMWVTAIQDHCILGLDFLRSTSSQLDLRTETLHFAMATRGNQPPSRGSLAGARAPLARRLRPNPAPAGDWLGEPAHPLRTDPLDSHRPSQILRPHRPGPTPGQRQSRLGPSQHSLDPNS